ncbi:L,D-transpeptidase family protein [Nonomuraea zeae]|uniref:Murein L,D-transpeptidase n=1 Tax=Nonomuraea zeae TaxID=1642303 RepID=A0A5S4GC82_9ACTN|nr:L,D-transpeptidase family protein [Nonomuraea zeae]TMR30124.1 murein L,D-transpeptidase [Nonomuraea zeae]
MAALATAGAVVLTGVLTGCGTQAGPRHSPAAPVTTSVTAPDTPAAGAGSGPASGRTTTAPRKTLKLGAKGKSVTWLQRRLTELGYQPGKADGRYGGTTLAAVWAFQKVNDIKPTSTVAKRTWDALEAPKPPKILVRNGKPTRAEVNLTKQIMVLYVGGQVKLITHVSSGSGIPYCETATWQGKEQRFCGSASTPTGNYKTTWRASGWHKSYLGELYNPVFFNGGIAFHGALSVPLYPASHGCVRMPMNVAQVLPGMLGKGVPVHVRGKFRRA